MLLALFKVSGHFMAIILSGLHKRCRGKWLNLTLSLKIFYLLGGYAFVYSGHEYMISYMRIDVRVCVCVYG